VVSVLGAKAQKITLSLHAFGVEEQFESCCHQEDSVHFHAARTSAIKAVIQRWFKVGLL
jgi:hypothetical protein